MKRLRVQLLLAFLLPIIIMVVSGAYSFFSVSVIREGLEGASTFQTQLSRAQTIVWLDEVLTQSLRNYIFTSDDKWKNRYFESAGQLDEVIAASIEHAGSEKTREIFERQNEANAKLIEMEDAAFALVDEEKNEEALALIEGEEYNKWKDIYTQTVNNFLGNTETGLEAFQEQLDSSVQQASKTSLYIILGTIIIGIFLFLFTFIMSGRIANPVLILTKQADKISMGDLEVDFSINLKNEIGQLANSFREMVRSIQDKSAIVEQIAQKDLSVEVRMASEKDRLGQSLIVMKESLNELLGQVNSSVEQVNSGAEQVSKASQDLSQGATEQASSLEEITSSTTEVNSQSKQNAENATEANALAKKASEDAESGNAQMKELVEAMNKINASSDEINKVVKVIDDIAFQINLLALNANVEAARAGKYGKGFAVVAEEVRNLAVRAADAVKETSQMVEESITNIKQGNGLVEKTAEQLVNINEGAGKVADFLGEIALASKEQAQAIEQITNGLDQVDQVTQANTASAEESASASEELASQAQQLRSMVAQFKLDDRYSGSGARLLTQGSHLNQGQGQRSTGRDHVPQRQAGMGDTSGQQSGGGARSRGYGNGNQETGVAPVKPEEQISLDDDFDRF